MFCSFDKNKAPIGANLKKIKNAVKVSIKLPLETCLKQVLFNTCFCSQFQLQCDIPARVAWHVVCHFLGLCRGHSVIQSSRCQGELPRSHVHWSHYGFHCLHFPSLDTGRTHGASCIPGLKF